MLIAILALTVFGPLEDLVSLNVAVGRTEKAVAALAKASGVPMSTIGPVGSEIVFVDVDKLPVGDVMNSVARVTASAWEKKPDGSYVLSRPSGITASELNKEVVRKVRALSTWRADLIKCLTVPYDNSSLVKVVKERSRLEAIREAGNTSQEDDEQAWKRVAELDHVDPIYRALARCIQGLDIRPMALLSPQESIVYTLHPNVVQRALPSSALEATRRLLSEQVAWGKALRQKPLGKGEDPKSQFMTDHTIEFFRDAGQGRFLGSRAEPWSRTLPFEGEPTHIVLTVSCYSEESYRMDLKMLAEDGQEVMVFECDDISTYDGEKSPSDPSVIAKLKNPEPSSETAALWARMKGQGDTVMPALAKLQRFFDDPVNNEPLWLGNQEILTSLATGKKKSVIACLPDDARWDFDEKLELQSLFDDKALAITETASCIELCPKSFAIHWIKKADRFAMAACAKDFRDHGRIDLLSFVRLVGNLGDSGDRSFCGLFVQLLDPEYRSTYGSFEIPFQSAFPTLLASLTPSQLARLTKGETIPYSALTGPQRSLAARIVYGIRVNVPTVGGPPVGWPTVSPTFELPTGVLGGIGLSGTFGKDEVAVFHNGKDGIHDDFYSVNLTEGWNGGFWSGPPPRVPSGGMVNATVTLHEENYVTLRCGLSAGHYVVGHFAEPLAKAKDEPILLGKLPQDIQNKLAKAVKFLDSMGGERFRRGDDNKTPPPRRAA